MSKSLIPAGSLTPLAVSAVPRFSSNSLAIHKQKSLVAQATGMPWNGLSILGDTLTLEAVDQLRRSVVGVVTDIGKLKEISRALMDRMRRSFLLEREQVNLLAEADLYIQWQWGNLLLRFGVKRGGAKSRGSTLRVLGVSKYLSPLLQRLAKIPIRFIQDYCAKARRIAKHGSSDRLKSPEITREGLFAAFDDKRREAKTRAFRITVAREDRGIRKQFFVPVSGKPPIFRQNTFYTGDALELLRQLPKNSIANVVTSPPYVGMVDYRVDGQLGLEQTAEQWLDVLMLYLEEVQRVLRPTGTFWLNVGDKYSGSGRGLKDYRDSVRGNRNRERYRDRIPLVKDDRPDGSLMQLGPRLSERLTKDLGMPIRQRIIWHKPDPMRESVEDRSTVDYEFVYMFAKDGKGGRYWYEMEMEKSKPGGVGNKHPRFPTREWRHPGSIWTIPTQPYGEHQCPFPVELARRCIAQGCSEGGVVLDPFMGVGTTAMAAASLGRPFIGFELNPEYVKTARMRVYKAHPDLKQDSL